MVTRLLPVVAAVSIVILHKASLTLWPIYIVLLYFTVLHALTWAELRLSVPLSPLIAIIIAAAVSRIGFRRPTTITAAT